MDDIIKIVFALLIFLGPVLFKVLGSMFEQPKPASTPSRLPPAQRQALEERARQLRMNKEAQALDAEVVVDEGHQSVFADSKEFRSGYDSSSESIDQRDDQMDSHLHDKFDHSIGSFGSESLSQVQEDVLGTESERAEPRENLAAGIAEMLRTPTDMRKAFIIGEILQRPNHD